jgi:hypothetical protein
MLSEQEYRVKYLTQHNLRLGSRGVPTGKLMSSGERVR